MHATRRLVPVLRILLVLAFVALLTGQLVAVPRVFDAWSSEVTETFGTTWPMLVVPVLELLCVQVVVVCTWRLLTLVEQDRIFSDDAFVWVNAITGAIAAAWLLLAAWAAYLLVVGSAGWLVVLLALLLVAGAVLGLLMVVLRALLRQATTLRADMAEVI